MKIIIYGSQYGTAREYAQELSERTQINAADYKDITDISRYDMIIYIGSLYAGSVLGLKKTLNKIEDASKRKIIIATVGLADPNDKMNTDGIVKKIRSQLSDDICSHTSIHFLRGAIDYSTLSFKHRTMMKFAFKRSKKLKEDEITPEVKAVLETYGKKVSYVDFDALNPIIDEINNQ